MIVEVVWMTVLELPVGDGAEVELTYSDYISANITISGAWQGVVSLKASEQFLTLCASRMFSCAPEDVSDMDRADALTELTNMLGGTVKCLLPETCNLSLPVVSTDDENEERREWVDFACESMPLSVAVTASDEGVSLVA